jgi:hypothetical protein
MIIFILYKYPVNKKSEDILTFRAEPGYRFVPPPTFNKAGNYFFNLGMVKYISFISSMVAYGKTSSPLFVKRDVTKLPVLLSKRATSKLFSKSP